MRPVGTSLADSREVVQRGPGWDDGFRIMRDTVDFLASIINALAHEVDRGRRDVEHMYNNWGC